MTNDKILELAKKYALINGDIVCTGYTYEFSSENLCEFAALIRVKALKEAAQACVRRNDPADIRGVCEWCAETILKLNKKKHDLYYMERCSCLHSQTANSWFV